MANKIFNAIIQLRRDNEFNFEPIKHTFVPAKGEVVLIDTARDGLRAKIGDGIHPLAQLIYADCYYRDALLTGYLENGVFYEDISKAVPLSAYTNKVYVDRWHNKVYYFDGEQYVCINSAEISTASASTPGILKLYNSTGYNEDGTMTQKAITQELEKKAETSIVEADELLILNT